MTEPIGIGIAEAAERMPISRSALYKMAERGEGPFRKIGGRWMTTPEALKSWIEQRRPEPEEDFVSEVLRLRREEA